MKIRVLHKQNLLDISIQHTGTIENCFKIAVANGLSVSDEIVPGQELIIPNDIKIDTQILNYYQSKEIQPATAELPKFKKLEGIDYWGIDYDFIVK